MKLNVLKNIHSFGLYSLFLLGGFGLFGVAEGVFSQKNPKTSYEASFLWFNFEKEPITHYTFTGSKYLLTDEIKKGFYDGVPQQLKYLRKRDVKIAKPLKSSAKSLGINVSWSRQGYNWIDIHLAKSHPLYDKPFPGKAKRLDLWVWGANYDYMLYVTLENVDGFTYDLLVGNLKFYGWKKMSVDIPPRLMVKKRHLAKEVNGLRFRRFRVYSSPLERVDRYSLFIDYVRIHTDLMGVYYDGVDLERLFFDDDAEVPDQNDEDNEEKTPNNKEN